MVRTARTSPICLVHLVYPVSLVQPNSLAGAGCLKLLREAELNRQRYPV